jgi:hypothetical protein
MTSPVYGGRFYSSDHLVGEIVVSTVATSGSEL